VTLSHVTWPLSGATRRKPATFLSLPGECADTAFIQFSAGHGASGANVMPTLDDLSTWGRVPAWLQCFGLFAVTPSLSLATQLILRCSSLDETGKLLPVPAESCVHGRCASWDFADDADDRNTCVKYSTHSAWSESWRALSQGNGNNLREQSFPQKKYS